MSLKKTAAALGVLGIVIAITIPDAEARRRGGFRMRGLPSGARYNGPTLTREQLRQCVAEQNAMNSMGSEADRLQADLTRSEASLNQLESQIKTQELLVDSYSQSSVDGFNALVNRHKRLVATHNAKLPAANARVEQFNVAVSKFNAKCADRMYYESDMQAVLSRK